MNGVTVNGVTLYTYNHRVKELHKITILEVYRDVRLSEIYIEVNLLFIKYLRGEIDCSFCSVL